MRNALGLRGRRGDSVVSGLLKASWEGENYSPSGIYLTRDFETGCSLVFHCRKQVTNTLSQKPSLICFHDCYKVSKTQSIPDQLPKPLPQDSIMQSLNLSSLLPSITHTQISTLTVWTDCYSSCRSDGQTFSIDTASPLLTSKEAQG